MQWTKLLICKDQAQEKITIIVEWDVRNWRFELEENIAERGQLASVGDLQVNSQRKNFRNNEESECGWLY